MDLYAEIILDHSKNPQNAGLRDPYEAEVHHVNTSCGDEVTVRVHVDTSTEPPRIVDVSYDAMGCSISTASTSVMTEETIGHDATEVAGSLAEMRKMLTSRGQYGGDEELIGDGVAFAGVSQYPARVKCALLGWTALTDALARAGVDITGSEQDSEVPTNGAQA